MAPDPAAQVYRSAAIEDEDRRCSGRTDRTADQEPVRRTAEGGCPYTSRRDDASGSCCVYVILRGLASIVSR